MGDNRRNNILGRRFRLDIALIICFFVLLLSFMAYMINTTLEDVLTKDGSSIVTHDYSSSAADAQYENGEDSDTEDWH